MVGRRGGRGCEDARCWVVRACGQELVVGHASGRCGGLWMSEDSRLPTNITDVTVRQFANVYHGVNEANTLELLCTCIDII